MSTKDIPYDLTADEQVIVDNAPRILSAILARQQEGRIQDLIRHMHQKGLTFMEGCVYTDERRCKHLMCLAFHPDKTSANYAQDEGIKLFQWIQELAQLEKHILLRDFRKFVIEEELGNDFRGFTVIEPLSQDTVSTASPHPTSNGDTSLCATVESPDSEPACLIAHPLCGKLVIVQGLKTHALNGNYAQVSTFDTEKGRYIITLVTGNQTGKQYALKADNLRAICDYATKPEVCTAGTTVEHASLHDVPTLSTGGIERPPRDVSLPTSNCKLKRKRKRDKTPTSSKKTTQGKNTRPSQDVGECPWYDNWINSLDNEKHRKCLQGKTNRGCMPHIWSGKIRVYGKVYETAVLEDYVAFPAKKDLIAEQENYIQWLQENFAHKKWKSCRFKSAFSGLIKALPNEEPSA